MNPPEAPNGRKPRIMFVDDETDNLSVYEYWCKQWGYEALGVWDSMGAVDLGRKFKPDLVFMDVHMPNIDGFEVMARFKADPDLSTVPIVMLTGGAIEVPDKVKGFTGGAIDYLLKPISPEEMCARIGSYLSLRSRARKQFEESEVKAVRQTAVFLNHSINNLLATIQVAAGVSVDEEDEDAQMRHEIIDQNVRAIAEIVQRLKDIKHIFATTYAGLEDMLDFDKSTERKE